MEETKKQVRNTAVLISIMALTLGTIAGFIAPGNLFQAGALVVVALIFIAFYAMQIFEPKKQEENDESSLVDYYNKISKHRKPIKYKQEERDENELVDYYRKIKKQ